MFHWLLNVSRQKSNQCWIFWGLFVFCLHLSQANTAVILFIVRQKCASSGVHIAGKMNKWTVFSPKECFEEKFWVKFCFYWTCYSKPLWNRFLNATRILGTFTSVHLVKFHAAVGGPGASAFKKKATYNENLQISKLCRKPSIRFSPWCQAANVRPPHASFNSALHLYFVQGKANQIDNYQFTSLQKEIKCECTMPYLKVKEITLSGMQVHRTR